MWRESTPILGRSLSLRETQPSGLSEFYFEFWKLFVNGHFGSNFSQDGQEGDKTGEEGGSHFQTAMIIITKYIIANIKMVLTIVTMTQGWFVAQTWYDASSTIVFLVNRREVEIMIIVIAPLLINPFEYLSKWVLPQANLCNIVFYDEMDGYTKNVNPHVMFMRYVLGENTFMHTAQVRIQLKELSEFPCSRGFPFLCDPSPPYFWLDQSSHPG